MSAEETIVVIDDQKEVRELLSEMFRARGRTVVGFATGEEGSEYLAGASNSPELVILDLDLGSGRKNGIEVCAGLREHHPDLPIIILTGSADIEKAVASIKAGATDFLVKDPYLEDQLEISVGKIERMMAHVHERRRLEGENRTLRAKNQQLEELVGTRWQIVGESSGLSEVVEKVERVAAVPRPVLVLGERGTGKELIARAIHHLSPRASEPYITINCAAVPESLLESELFGHEEGAFTGATRQKAGKFEAADGGTLFLDEVGTMSLDFQAKILRVIEYQRFERVAGSDSIQVDVRVIAATNADLEGAMSRGEFRRDLYDRLAFEIVELPPLRERLDDIPALAAHFLARFGNEVSGLRVQGLSADALDALARYDFPGNVRELKNVVERAAYSSSGDMIRASEVVAALPHVEPQTAAASDLFADDPSIPLGARVEAFERALCKGALEQTRYNQREAAELLGITYDQFRQRYRKYGLSKD